MAKAFVLRHTLTQGTSHLGNPEPKVGQANRVISGGLYIQNRNIVDLLHRIKRSQSCFEP